jgi:predicted ATPase
MLTRLKVSGFKNLVNVDVRFGPFTCIAGGNGVGKSNLFDAIQFLSALSDRPLMEAAASLRGGESRSADIRSLFHRVGDQYADEMCFQAEMIIPNQGTDDLGQAARTNSTLLRYTLKLSYRNQEINVHQINGGTLEIVEESLVQINKGSRRLNSKTIFEGSLLFSRSGTWTDSVVHSGGRIPPFISTVVDNESRRVVLLHQDPGIGRGDKKGGKSIGKRSLLAANLPRTVLSDANASEHTTAVLARREMQSWKLLQLEPSALRKPDEFTATPRLGLDGSHLPATLYHLVRQEYYASDQSGQLDNLDDSSIYSYVSNSLAALLGDTYHVNVDRDERRELLTLQLIEKGKTPHSAKFLSDGTLRFIALIVLELDPNAQGVICLEEPENGIPPARIPAMLDLLEKIATDVDEAVGLGNPFRQVIFNTHSPAVVAQVPDDSLIFAELREEIRYGQRFKAACFSCLPGTWRADAPEKPRTLAKGKLLSYLEPVVRKSRNKGTENQSASEQLTSEKSSKYGKKNSQRVIDRPEFEQLLLLNISND